MKVQGFAQGLYSTSADKKERLGTIRITDDGRTFRYALNGTTALTTGVTTTMIGVTADHIERTIVTAPAIGDYEVQVTVSTSAVTADSYADGYLQVNKTTGTGQSYLIDSNTSCASAGTTIVTLKDPIRVAPTTSSEVSLIPNPWYGTVIQATTTTGPAGVTVCAVPASHYYWSQTGGMGCVLAKGSDAVGSWQGHGSTDGSADIENGYLSCRIGQVISTANVATEYKPIWLQID